MKNISVERMANQDTINKQISKQIIYDIINPYIPPEPAIINKN